MKILLFALALFSLPAVVVAQMMYTGGMMGYQNYQVIPDDQVPSSGKYGSVQKIYDHDEGVICYVYLQRGISCVNDLN